MESKDSMPVPTEKEKDDKDAYKRGASAEKRTMKILIPVCSIVCLALGGVAGALIYSAVDGSGVSPLTREIYDYLKNEWLYAGTYEEFADTFNSYMIQGMLDRDNDPYTFYTSTAEEPGLSTSGSGIYGFSSSNFAVSVTSAGTTSVDVPSGGKTYGGLLIRNLYNGTFKAAGVKVGDVIIGAKHSETDSYTYIENLSPNATSVLIKPTDEKKKDPVYFLGVRDNTLFEYSCRLGNYTEDSVSFIEDTTYNGKHVLALKISTFLGQNNSQGKNSPTTLVSSYIKDSIDSTNKNIDELVLDCRDNGGGFTDEACNLAALFLDKGSIIFQEGDNDGNIKRVTKQNNSPSFSKEKVKDIRIILNGGSASATELFAKALSENSRATIYGTTSYGKGIEQAVINLKNGGTLRLTTMKIYGPKGTTFDGVGKKGIVPDVETNDYVKYSKHLVSSPYIKEASADDSGYRLTYNQEQTILSGLQLFDDYKDETDLMTALNKFQSAEGIAVSGNYDTYTLYRYYRQQLTRFYQGEAEEVETVIKA